MILDTGKTDFYQVKIVDESLAKIGEEESEEEYSVKDEGDERVHLNSEHHIMWKMQRK